MVSHWVMHVAIVREIRVTPVDNGKIQAYLDSFCTESFQEFFYQVFVAGCVHGIVVGQLGVKQAETVMMLGSKYGVLHAGFLCQTSPFSWIVIFCCKFFCQWAVLLMGNLLHTSYPLTTGWNCIQPPVDKHAETGITVPLGTFGSFFDYFIHFFVLSYQKYLNQSNKYSVQNFIMKQNTSPIPSSYLREFPAQMKALAHLPPMRQLCKGFSPLPPAHGEKYILRYRVSYACRNHRGSR